MIYQPKNNMCDLQPAYLKEVGKFSIYGVIFKYSEISRREF